MNRAMRTFMVIFLNLILLSGIVSAEPKGVFDLQGAIDAAQPGALLDIPWGVYAGSIQIDKPIHLRGVSGPQGERAIIDGEGSGSVVTITAPEVVLENLTVRNSGNNIDQEDGGITVDGAVDVLLLDNRLEDVLYGVRGIKAHRLTMRHNTISGKELDIARRGDGIRLWQSEDCLVEGNTLERVRDAIFWFSDGTTVRGNLFQDNRYGVHMMYTDGMRVLENYMNGNSVGAYLMYSVNVQVIGNTFERNRGPSGYGLALKDMDGVTASENYMIENRVGIFFDNSPSRIDIEQQIEGNVFAFNDIGVLMMPAVKRNNLQQNSFIDNLEQVGIKGGGSQAGEQLGGNDWDGNYWSDYVGYDGGESTRDGIGDLPYRAESLFENIADRYPHLKLFQFSPVESALDMAARIFPVIKPKPKLTDSAPLMLSVLPTVPVQVRPFESNIGLLAAGLLLGSFLFLGIQLWPGRRRPSPAIVQSGASNPASDEKKPAGSISLPTNPTHEARNMLQVDHLTKRYPRPGRAWWSDATVTAVDEISFSVGVGESVALWGVNGAGKTTVMKSLLGLLHCEGAMRLDGLDLRRDGRKARALLGYVSQELAFHTAMSVVESCRFYAALKDVSPERILPALELVGLADQAEKMVGALSGGMKQRLALALALLADPPLLLLDEPTSNLDAEARDEFIQTLNELRKSGKSLLFTSHRVEEIEQLADRVLILKDGRLVAQGTPTELMSHLAPERQKTRRHIRVVTALDQQIRACEVLTAAGYSAEPNGRGLWVEVAHERKAAPLSALFTADIEVLDVEM